MQKIIFLFFMRGVIFFGRPFTAAGFLMTKYSNITIRPAVCGDLDEIYSLEQAYSQNPWSRASIASELYNANAIFLVLQTPENQIIGFACSSLILDEVHILETVVCPDFRNGGLGYMLINRLLTEAADKDAARACLEARLSNRPAIRVYEKCGFEKDAVRKKYYQNGEDAVLMSKTISK